METIDTYGEHMSCDHKAYLALIHRKSRAFVERFEDASKCGIEIKIFLANRKKATHSNWVHTLTHTHAHAWNLTDLSIERLERRKKMVTNEINRENDESVFNGFWLYKIALNRPEKRVQNTQPSSMGHFKWLPNKNGNHIELIESHWWLLSFSRFSNCRQTINAVKM